MSISCSSLRSRPLDPRRLALGLAACATAFLGAPRPCAAVDPEEVYRAAVAEMKAGNPAACPKFAESHRLKPDSTAALQGLAQCYDKFGKTASAWAKYRELTVELKTRGDAQRSLAAADRAEELGKILSTLLIKLGSPNTPGLIIRLDKDEVLSVMIGSKINVDPGQHILEATAPGYDVWQTTLQVGEKNDAREVQIPALVPKAGAAQAAPGQAAPAPLATPAVSFWGAQRIAGVALGGAGVAGAVVGAIFGVQAISRKNSSNANGHCNAADLCDMTGKGLRSDSIHAGNLSTGLFAAGGALVVGGLVLVLTAPSGGEKAKAAAGPTAGLVVGPGALTLRGRW